MKTSYLPDPITNFYIGEDGGVRVKCFTRAYRLNKPEEAVALCREYQKRYLTTLALWLAYCVLGIYVIFSLPSAFLSNAIVYSALFFFFVLSHSAYLIRYSIRTLGRPVSFEKAPKKIDQTRNDNRQLYFNLLKNTRRGTLIVSLCAHLLWILASAGAGFFVAQHLSVRHQFQTMCSEEKSQAKPEKVTLDSKWGKSIQKQMDQLVDSSDALTAAACKSNQTWDDYTPFMIVFAVVCLLAGIKALHHDIQIFAYVLQDKEAVLE